MKNKNNKSIRLKSSNWLIKNILKMLITQLLLDLILIEDSWFIQFEKLFAYQCCILLIVVKPSQLKHTKVKEMKKNQF